MSRLALDTADLAASAMAVHRAADLLVAAREHLDPFGARPAGHLLLDAAIDGLGAGWAGRHTALVEALAALGDALRAAAERFADAEEVNAAGFARLLLAPAPATGAPGSAPGGGPTTATAL